MQVTIIGGGVIGLCSAYYLNKAGHEVTVIERNDITDGCSFGNMGYISPSHFTPIATPGMVSQGIRWMLSSSSPFYIKPRMNLDLIHWGMAFRKSATASKVEESGRHLNDLLHLSRELMLDFKSTFHDSFDMMEKGCWMLYRSEKTGDHEKHLAEKAAAFGLKTIACSPQEVQDRETEVEVNVAGGVLYLDDCHLNPGKFMQALYTHLKEAGVKFWLNTEVMGFKKNNERIVAVLTDKARLEAEEVVLANGSWLPEIAAKLGIRILLQPGKGYSVVYENMQRNLLYPSILVDDRTATTPIHRWLRIGGTMELSGHSESILPKRVMAIYHAVKKYYPKLEIPTPDLKKAWFGYRPVTPDGLPYIGRYRDGYKNICFAGGHAMLGVSAAAATGKLVEEVIGHKKNTIDLSAFEPSRFR
jgi:D-amino-acid dehydrogenase